MELNDSAEGGFARGHYQGKVQARAEFWILLSI